MSTATLNTTDCAKSSQRFYKKISKPLKKKKITVLQVNLGRRCNLACSHCHVEASPQRTEEIDATVRDNLIKIIHQFDQLETVDLTGGAPEMHFGFKDIVKAARSRGKEVIVRSNLTIFFVEGYEWIPQFLADQKVHIVASLPCYLEDNVDQMRGQGVFKDSIRALQVLNELGFGETLKLDLVYNPPVPRKDGDFRLAPPQKPLEADYKKFLGDNFNVHFNNLFAITNLPIGRFKKFLKFKKIDAQYTDFLEEAYNSSTLPFLMCNNQLSVDFNGKIYDCDFNQIEDIPALYNGKPITLEMILENNSLDLIDTIQVRDFCFGCTAGNGSSCGGNLLD